METNNNFLEEIKNLKYKDEIILNNISGIITEIEEVEYQKFNLTIEIKGKIYKGIYIEYTKKKK